MHVAKGINGAISPEIMESAKNLYDKRGNEFATAMEAWIIPDEKIEDVVNYGIKMIAGQPQMKVARVARKTAEYFKLKRNPAAKSQDE